MSFKVQHEFLFLGRDEGDSFVENYAYDLGENGENSGKIFLNIEIQNNPAEAEHIAEVIFDTVRKSFFSDLEKDPYVRFEDALKEVNNALNTLREEKVSKFLGNLHIIIAIVVGNNLYLSQCGDAEAYLIRRRYTSVISEGLYDPHSKDFFSNIANGELEPGDLVLLCSTRLLRYIAKTDLAKITGSRNLVAILGELKDYLAAEVLIRMGFIGIYALESAVPELSPTEQGKVVEHLQKEEDFDHHGTHEHKKVDVTFSDIARKASKVVSNTGSRVRSFLARQNFGGSNGRENGPGSWSKQKILTALGAVVFLLVIGIWWNNVRAEEQRKIENFEKEIRLANESINAAESHQSISTKEAHKFLDEAEAHTQTVLNGGYNRTETSKLLGKIERLRDEIDKIQRPEVKPLVDLSTKRANVSALGLLKLKEALYAYEYNALYPILLDKLEEPIRIHEDENVVAATVHEDNDSLLFYTKNQKIIEYKDGRFQSMPTPENNYHKGVAVQTYGSRFYILSPEENEIWRYVTRKDQFNKPDAYNEKDIDIKNAVSFAIDSNIYVLNNDGSIIKFLSGNKQNLTIEGGPSKEMKQPTKIFTLPEMSSVYILEPSQKRVLVYKKEDDSLVYTSQFVFDDIPEIKDILVDQEEKNLYLLDEKKVYKVALAENTL